jgi:hypothetical protein
MLGSGLISIGAIGAWLIARKDRYLIESGLIIVMDSRPELEPLIDYLLKNRQLGSALHDYDKLVAEKQALYSRMNMLGRKTILPNPYT